MIYHAHVCNAIIPWCSRYDICGGDGGRETGRRCKKRTQREVIKREKDREKKRWRGRRREVEGGRGEVEREKRKGGEEEERKRISNFCLKR